MRTLIVALSVALFATAVRAQEKKSPPLPKNERLIELLQELKGAKDRKDRDAILLKASTDSTIDGETASFVAKARKGLNGTAALCIQETLKAERPCEAREALALVEVLSQEDADALDASERYFGSGVMYNHFTQLGDWRVALGDKDRANKHYHAAVNRLKRLHSLAVAQGWIKEYEEGLKAIRKKIAEIK